jgi:transposase-like protein
MTYQTREIEVSHVSLHRWVHALRGVISNVLRTERKVVAMNGTKPKINER